MDPGGLIDRILAAASDSCEEEGLRLLRVYWYDGAINGIPTREQIAVGDLARVKLRLGRITGGGQKGVDGLIILDLINLARNRAVDVAVLLTGDEDLREAALHAQGFGLTLVVAGLPEAAGQRQSALLLRKADHVVRLSREDVAQHLQLRQQERAPATPLDEASLLTDHELQESGPDRSAPTPEDALASLEDLCRGIIVDPRFGNVRLLIDRSGTTPRLTRQADRVLVARLADLTGQFPVDQAVLAPARKRCIELAELPPESP